MVSLTRVCRVLHRVLFRLPEVGAPFGEYCCQPRLAEAVEPSLLQLHDKISAMSSQQEVPAGFSGLFLQSQLQGGAPHLQPAGPAAAAQALQMEPTAEAFYLCQSIRWQAALCL